MGKRRRPSPRPQPINPHVGGPLPLKSEVPSGPDLVTNEMRAKLLEGMPSAMQGILDQAIKNGLAGAMGFPGGIGNPYSAPLSQANTIFENLRWYLVSNYRQMLSEAYVEIGLIQTIVEVPVDDALRGGIIIKSEQLSEDQVKELQISIDRDDDLATVGFAEKWNRLFGGGGIIVITDQNPELPLNLDAINKDTPLEFRDVDLWELFWSDQNLEGWNMGLQGEEIQSDTYDYYAVKLHKTRVMPLKGKKAPSFIRPRLRGWGFSYVEALVRSINQYLKASDLSFQVLDEFKVDVYKINNLVNTLFQPGGQQKVQERIQLANAGKNYQNAIILDSADEWDHKQLSFTGLSEAMTGIRMHVAADMRMPICKLFGSQAGGLNPDDETDLEVYNGMVESDVRGKIKYPILRILELKCQKLFGFVPDDLEIEFHPLRMLKATDEETVKTSKFARALQGAQAGYLTPEEFRDICNKDKLFPVHLDTDAITLDTADPDVAAEGDNNPKNPKGNDPGADKEDSNSPNPGGGDSLQTSAEYILNNWKLMHGAKQ